MINVKQLSAKQWIRGIARPAACVGATPRDICLSHGIEFDYFEGDSGLGEEEAALLQTHAGHYFGLIRYPMAREKNYTAILVDEVLKDVTDYLNDILCDMRWRSSDVLWFDLDRYQFVPCKLFREDDHGNRIVIADFNCFPDAFFQKEILESRGHKQSYFIEIGAPKERKWTGSWKARV